MRSRFSLLVSMALLFQLVTPAFSQSPCDDERYLELKKKPLGEMSEREYQYFIQKDQECSEYQQAMLKEASRPESQEVKRGGSDNLAYGHAAMSVGAVTFALAAVIKDDKDEYSDWNYAFMVAGGIFFIYGSILTFGSLQKQNSSLSLAPIGPSPTDWGIVATRTF